MLMGQPFYIRTSLKNTALPKSEVEDMAHRDAPLYNNQVYKTEEDRLENRLKKDAPQNKDRPYKKDTNAYYERPAKKYDDYQKTPPYQYENRPKKYRDSDSGYVQKKPVEEYMPKKYQPISDNLANKNGSSHYNKDEYVKSKYDTTDRGKPKDYYYDDHYRQKDKFSKKTQDRKPETNPKEYVQKKDIKDETPQQSSTYTRKDQQKSTSGFGEKSEEYGRSRGQKNKKPRNQDNTPKEQKLKLTTLDPQEVINQQRASKAKGKQSYATPNIFELLDVSD